MKAVCLILAFVLPCACRADPETRTDSKRAPLKGKVKIVRSSNFPGSTEAEAQAMSFDKNNYSVDSYSITGLKLYTHWIDHGALTDITTYRYDAKGNKIEECSRNNRVSTIICTSYIYNTAGNLIKETCYVDGRVHVTIAYTYVFGLRATKELSIDELVTKTDYKYDADKRLLKETEHAGERDYITLYTYCDDGNMRSEIQLSGPSFILETTYTYDEHDNEVLAEERVNDGPVRRSFVSEYIYDSNGNWTRAIEDLVDGLDDRYRESPPPKGVDIREIEYY